MNRTFVFFREKKEKIYTKAQTKIMQHKIFLEKGKYVFLVSWFLINIISYGYLVNSASTRGYFLSKAQEERRNIEFSYNITTLNMTEYHRTLRNQMHSDYLTKKIHIVSDLAKNEADGKDQKDIAFAAEQRYNNNM